MGFTESPKDNAPSLPDTIITKVPQTPATFLHHGRLRMTFRTGQQLHRIYQILALTPSEISTHRMPLRCHFGQAGLLSTQHTLHMRHWLQSTQSKVANWRHMTQDLDSAWSI